MMSVFFLLETRLKSLQFHKRAKLLRVRQPKIDKGHPVWRAKERRCVFEVAGQFFSKDRPSGVDGAGVEASKTRQVIQEAAALGTSNLEPIDKSSHFELQAKRSGPEFHLGFSPKSFGQTLWTKELFGVSAQKLVTKTLDHPLVDAAVDTVKDVALEVAKPARTMMQGAAHFVEGAEHKIQCVADTMVSGARHFAEDLIAKTNALYQAFVNKYDTFKKNGFQLDLPFKRKSPHLETSYADQVPVAPEPLPYRLNLGSPYSRFFEDLRSWSNAFSTSSNPPVPKIAEAKVDAMDDPGDSSPIPANTSVSNKTPQWSSYRSSSIDAHSGESSSGAHQEIAKQSTPVAIPVVTPLAGQIEFLAETDSDHQIEISVPKVAAVQDESPKKAALVQTQVVPAEKNQPQIASTADEAKPATPLNQDLAQVIMGFDFTTPPNVLSAALAENAGVFFKGASASGTLGVMTGREDILSYDQALVSELAERGLVAFVAENSNHTLSPRGDFVHGTQRDRDILGTDGWSFSWMTLAGGSVALHDSSQGQPLTAQQHAYNVAYSRDSERFIPSGMMFAMNRSMDRRPDRDWQSDQWDFADGEANRTQATVVNLGDLGHGHNSSDQGPDWDLIRESSRLSRQSTGSLNPVDTPKTKIYRAPRDHVVVV